MPCKVKQVEYLLSDVWKTLQGNSGENLVSSKLELFFLQYVKSVCSSRIKSDIYCHCLFRNNDYRRAPVSYLHSLSFCDLGYLYHRWIFRPTTEPCADKVTT